MCTLTNEIVAAARRILGSRSSNCSRNNLKSDFSRGRGGNRNEEGRERVGERGCRGEGEGGRRLQVREREGRGTQERGWGREDKLATRYMSM